MIKKEKFTSIQEAQAGLTNLLKTAEKEGFFYRVLRRNKETTQPQIVCGSCYRPEPLGI